MVGTRLNKNKVTIDIIQGANQLMINSLCISTNLNAHKKPPELNLTASLLNQDMAS